MSWRDNTNIGGSNDSFASTRWTQVLGVRTDSDERRQALLNELLGRYWKPVYSYLRRKGRANEGV